MWRSSGAIRTRKEEYAVSIQFVPGETLPVPVIPFKDLVRLPAAETAVVVVDMQNDFVRPGGSLVVPAAGATVANIARLLEAARAQGVRVAYTQDSHLPDDPEFAIWPAHARIETPGWEIVEELKPRPGDLVCRKSRYDAFYDTWLDHFLTRVWEVRNLVLVGTVANICVLHTAASAGLRRFHVVLPVDGISALNDFDLAMTLRQVSWLYEGSVVREVDDIEFGS
jgi:nicotinamidase-related amidase